ncbi:hypothetical protein TYRP_009364 [Tyrophagus putrescentiae]|nr:hypothetical protein TYRP_009364 [Tyrophagus putrescentiae]
MLEGRRPSTSRCSLSSVSVGRSDLKDSSVRRNLPVNLIDRYFSRLKVLKRISESWGVLRMTTLIGTVVQLELLEGDVAEALVGNGLNLEVGEDEAAEGLLLWEEVPIERVEDVLDVEVLVGAAVEEVGAEDEAGREALPAAVADAHHVLQAGADLAELVEDPPGLAVAAEAVAAAGVLRRLEGDHIALVFVEQRAEDPFIEVPQLGIARRLLAEQQADRALRLREGARLDARVGQIVARQVDLQRLRRLPAEAEGVLVDLVDAVEGEVDGAEVGEVVEGVAAYLADGRVAAVRQPRLDQVERPQVGEAGDGVEGVPQLPALISQARPANVQLLDELLRRLEGLRVDGGQLGAVVELDAVEGEVVEEVAGQLADGRVLQDELVEALLPAELAEVLREALEVDLQAAGAAEGELLPGSVGVEDVLHAQVLLALLAADEAGELGRDPLPVVGAVLAPAGPEQFFRGTATDVGDGQVEEAGEAEQGVLHVEGAHLLYVGPGDVEGVRVDEFEGGGAVKSPVQRMMRAPLECSKHSQGAKRCEGGQELGAERVEWSRSKVMFPAAEEVRGVLLLFTSATGAGAAATAVGEDAAAAAAAAEATSPWL